VDKNYWIDSIILDLYQNGRKHIYEMNSEFVVAKQEMLANGIIQQNEQIRDMIELTPLGYEIAEFGMPYSVWIKHKNGILDASIPDLRDSEYQESVSLEERLPINLPTVKRKNPYNTTLQKGIPSVRKWMRKDFINKIVYPVLAAIIAAIVFKKC